MKLLRLVLIITALVLLVALAARAQGDVGVPDTLRIDTTIAYLDREAVLPVYFYNDAPITVIEATMKHDSPYLVFDSFSVAGGRVEGTLFSSVATSLADSAFTIFFFSSLIDGWPAGSGLLGKAYFHFDLGVVPHQVSLDTMFYQTTQTDHSTFFWSADLTPALYKPQIVKGQIDVQEPPLSFDSLWIGDAKAEPGESFCLEVGLFNERSTMNATLSLSYSEDVLSFDSISMANTRRPSAQFTVTPNTSLQRVRLDMDFSDANPLPAGSGIIANLCYTVKGDAVDTDVTFDTTASQPTFITLSSSAGGNQFTPGFHPGTLLVRKTTDVGDGPGDALLPGSFALAQNYPNPFNPSTMIEFALPLAGHVTLDVYNLLGRKVRTLVDESLPAGVHQVIFDGQTDDGKELATGVYFYRIESAEFTDSRKMLLLK